MANYYEKSPYQQGAPDTRYVAGPPASSGGSAWIIGAGLILALLIVFGVLMSGGESTAPTGDTAAPPPAAVQDQSAPPADTSTAPAAPPAAPAETPQAAPEAPAPATPAPSGN